MEPLHTGITAVADVSRRHFKVARFQDPTLSCGDQGLWEMVSNIAHDLNTPVHHIKGYVALLLNQATSEDRTIQRDYLEIIADESNRLIRLIEDLSDVSLLESDAFRFEIDTVAVDQLIQRTVERWQYVKSHSVKVETLGKVPPVLADAQRIEQALDNLIVNVTRHTPERTEVVVSVDVNPTEVIVSVSDNGPGIKPEHVPFLFERCYRAKRQGRRSAGTGLGLYICRQIIERHGGRIWAETLPGCGATFRFSLPR